MTEGRYKSQEELILAALLAGRKLTPIDALNDFQCFRLGARIWSLKKAGHKIEDHWVRVGQGHKTVKEYFIPSQPSLIQK